MLLTQVLYTFFTGVAYLIVLSTMVGPFVAMANISGTPGIVGANGTIHAGTATFNTAKQPINTFLNTIYTYKNFLNLQITY